MRAPLTALLGLGILSLGVACVSRTRADAAPPETVASVGSGGDPCAAYIERVTSGVRCQAVDDSHCTCELVGDAGTTPVVLDAQAGAASTPAGTGDAAQPAASGTVATLEFAPGPPNTIVQCMSGPCPSRSADFITEPHAPIAVPPGGTTVELEFRAPGHQRQVSTYTLKPGKNYIEFALTPAAAGPPDAAKLKFDGAPQGLTIECVSGPCPDHKPYPADRFPELPLTEDRGEVLLGFKAPGHRPATTAFQIRRGPNLVPVVMERAPLGK